jgi:hypothetical protein
MPTMTASATGYRLLQCSDCPTKFRYPITSSNNYPKFCPDCRRMRTVTNKRRFDERRGLVVRPFAHDVYDSEIHRALEQIPDYVMHPAKVVDAMMRECGG